MYNFASVDLAMFNNLNSSTFHFNERSSLIETNVPYHKKKWDNRLKT